MHAPPAPISPELVLVTPELRALAIRELWELEADAARSPEPMRPPAHERTDLPIPAQLALYAGWQVLSGAVFGLAAFAVFVALLLLKPLIGG
jgi:hypothetical protein